MAGKDVDKFLEILGKDIEENPAKLVPLNTDLLNAIESLVDGVEVDLDEPI